MMRIPENELKFKFARSSGPGGQNVNKVNSKAILIWDFLSSSAFHDEEKERLSRNLKRYFTKDGEIQVSSERYRTQGQNREDCIEKLEALVEKALIIVAPRKKPRKNKAAIRKRFDDKRKRSLQKKSRSIRE